MAAEPGGRVAPQTFALHDLSEPRIRVAQLPWLARKLGAGKRRGLARLGQKIAKAVFRLVHGPGRFPVRGKLEVLGPSGSQSLRVDASNTAFAALAHAAAIGGYEPEVTTLLEAVAGRLRTVYDIGANWGYYALLLATAPGFAGTVHAFEPSPRTFRDLQRTIGEAGIGRRVVPHRLALSDAEGMARLVEGRHSGLARRGGTGASGTEVQVRRLDDLGLPAPDLIKIDVEGHEWAVLAGAARVLRQARPLVVLESWFRPQDVRARWRRSSCWRPPGMTFSVSSGRASSMRAAS